MTNPTILVCDDSDTRVLHWVDCLRGIPAVEEAFDVKPLLPAQFAAAYAALKKRRQGHRPGDAGDPPDAGPDDASPLDQAAMVIVDFDLTPERPAPEDRTAQQDGIDRELNGEFGDMFAYLARCYSTAGYIEVFSPGGSL